jgi:hypothetical protein
MRSIGYGALARRVGIAQHAESLIPTRLARLKPGSATSPFQGEVEQVAHELPHFGAEVV